MQVIIDQIVSQVRAFDANLSTETLQKVVAAALEAVKAERQQQNRVSEENSLQNHQRRDQPWRS